MAASTRRRVASLTSPRPVTTRETVIEETPLRSATSFRLGWGIAVPFAACRSIRDRRGRDGGGTRDSLDDEALGRRRVDPQRNGGGRRTVVARGSGEGHADRVLPPSLDVNVQIGQLDQIGPQDDGGRKRI